LIYPTDAREGYGARISGYFTPQVTTNYTFYLRSDDSSQLWLSTDANPANTNLLTAETACCNPFSAHASASTSRVAGQPYYLELLYKEGTGGDYGQAAMKITGDPTSPDSLLPINSLFLSSLADPVGASITITQQPSNKTFAGATAAFTVDLNSNDGGFTVQTPQAYPGAWHYDGTAGSWREDGEDAEDGHPNTSLLTSPSLTVRASGAVVLTFSHRYSREPGQWDGAQVRVSVNGGPFTPVPGSAFTQNGYNGTVLANSASLLAGQEAFVNDSPGYASGMITSVANLGNLNAGDTIRIQFVAASDTNTRGTVPNWEIDSVSAPALDYLQGATVSTVTFSVGATGVNFESGTNPPTVYQWFRNDGAGFKPIIGADRPSYSLAPQLADNNAQFQAAVYIPGAQAASTPATLTVTGGAAPGRLSIVKSGGQVTISWTSSNCLQETTALGPSAVWTSSAVVNGVPFTPGAGNKFYRLNACP
jgi:hypothetical protein